MVDVFFGKTFFFVLLGSTFEITEVCPVVTRKEEPGDGAWLDTTGAEEGEVDDVLFTKRVGSILFDTEILDNEPFGFG